MAAAAARTVQIVKPHVAMISFPLRGSPSGQAAASSSAQVTTPVSSLPSSTLAETYQKPVGSTPRGSGIEWHQLPPKYHRRPIDNAEIEYIMRGGPE